MTSRSECVRGCLRPEVHLTDCPASANPAEPCPVPRRCAGAVVLEGFVVCETCRKRIRGLLRIAPDLLGRLRALAGHGKAVVYSPVKTTASASTAPDQVDAEVADALIEISQNLRDWSRWINMRTLDGVDRILADADLTLSLAAAVIDVHTPDEDGGRHWSIADAAQRWDVERRDRHAFVYTATEEDAVIERQPVTEWYDPLLTIRQAASRVKRTQRSIEMWIEKGDLKVAMRVRLPDGTVLKSVYASAVDAAAAGQKRGRPRRVTADTLQPISP